MAIKLHTVGTNTNFKNNIDLEFIAHNAFPG
jgi:hypothetical protein